MDINIKYDINDISAEILETVGKTVDELVTAEVKRLASLFKTKTTELISEITTALEIKDTRQRERIKRSMTNSLDKWVTKNGR